MDEEAKLLPVKTLKKVISLNAKQEVATEELTCQRES